jgi:hypothetical protein
MLPLSINAGTVWNSLFLGFSTGISRIGSTVSPSRMAAAVVVTGTGDGAVHFGGDSEREELDTVFVFVFLGVDDGYLE